MSSAVAELEAGLQAMLSLKPPGVSGSRIQSITALCTANVQSESVLIQKLYTHFKKAPGTHKLGVLYVVDSVTRKWTEQAKTAGQLINSAAPDGTFAAGVNRVKELLPVLMNDIIQTAPEDQKDKIRKLVDIWEKGQTFPLQMLTSFKEKLNAPSQNRSTTPDGSPPPEIQNPSGVQQQQQQPSASTPGANTYSILAALANMARQHTSAPQANPSTQPQDNPYTVSTSQNNLGQQAAALSQPAPSYQPMPQPVNVPASTTSFPSQLSAATNSVQSYPAQPNAFPAAAPAPIVPPAGIDPTVQQQLVLIKTLSDQGFPPDKIASIIAAMSVQNSQLPGVAGNMSSQFPPNATQSAQASQPWGQRPDESRDRNGFQDGVRSPPGRYRRRSRSPSPSRQWGRDSPARRRDDEYGRESPGRSRGRGGYGNDFRQRSPLRRARSPTPPRHGAPKFVDFDPTIGLDQIKVLSRTLFVGGVTIPDYELRSIFERFGKVQTCIVNKEKRHAFVKMISRKDAVNAKDLMEKGRGPDSSLRTRWGVGFGPRDCSDYATGVSVIPISKLTDADRKWMLTAEYGGSGGKPIEGGMVVEEPDIEIGQGVSSKAISRRMQTDKAGSNGPRSGRRDDDEERYRGDRDDRRDDDRTDRLTQANAPVTMPQMPGFPYPMPTLPNGMPMFPPNFFSNQAQAQQQQPPPGHRI
ncbi:hypothetical protein B7463_g3681, partial [Scytalidium lignicola]